MSRKPDVRVGRIYDQPSADDGRRVLVDRLWPRGISKDSAQLDEWLKAAAPSTELRRWYSHDPKKFAEFRRRYIDEMREPEPADALNRLTTEAQEGPVTLLTASRDAGHSEAAVLAEEVLARLLGDMRRDRMIWALDEDRPGDPACWMMRVCPACGAMADSDPPVTCPQCHAVIPGR